MSLSGTTATRAARKRRRRNCRSPISKMPTGAKFDALVLAPGVPLTHPEPHWTVKAAQQHNVPVIGDVELFARQRAHDAPDAPFVAITGTNGKSTTTALTAHILSSAGRDVQVGGNLGTPILALEPPKQGRYHVDRIVVLPDRADAVAETHRRHHAQSHARSSRSPRHHGALRGDQIRRARSRAISGHRRR